MAGLNAYRTKPDDRTGVPPGIPYIISNEAAERFSFYGMGAVLAVFLTEHLPGTAGELAPLSENAANEWQHYFYAACYLTPILGALLSDWLLGKYRTIMLLSVIYCGGHAVMALVDYAWMAGVSPRWTLACALGLIALGVGGIKPCVSAHVGDQFGASNRRLMPKVFGWFYFSINLGSMLSAVATPLLLKNFGAGVAFGVPGLLMAVATLVFWLGRREYVHIPPGGDAFLRESLGSEGLRALARLAPLFLLLSPFWALFNQTHSSWVHQAKLMDRTVLGWTIEPSQMQALNPLLVLLLIPVFSYFVYPLVGRFVNATPLRRIGAGLAIAGPSFAIIALAQQQIDQGQTPSILWQVAAYIVLTAAEVLVSITALEFAYTQGPKTMKSLIVGAYFLSNALGNWFTASVNGYIEGQRESGIASLEGASYFWFFVWIMAATTAVYAAYAATYRGREILQSDAASAAGEQA